MPSDSQKHLTIFRTNSQSHWCWSSVPRLKELIFSVFRVIWPAVGNHKQASVLIGPLLIQMSSCN